MDPSSVRRRSPKRDTVQLFYGRQFILGELLIARHQGANFPLLQTSAAALSMVVFRYAIHPQFAICQGDLINGGNGALKRASKVDLEMAAVEDPPRKSIAGIAIAIEFHQHFIARLGKHHRPPN